VIKPNWPLSTQIQAFSSTKGLKPDLGLDFSLPHDRVNLKHILGLKEEVLWVNQVHGGRVLDLDSTFDLKDLDIFKADAVFTRVPGRLCVIRTADCLPVLLCNREETIVAAVHAGWRSLAAGILENCVQAIGCDPKEIYAYLGPAIGPDYFEVGAELRSIFLEQAVEAELAFKSIINIDGLEKFLANLPLLATQQLCRAGLNLNNIYSSNLCTYSDPNLFYSYRRDKGHCGRMVTGIWMEI
jgi:YfiH family protein